MPVLVTKIERVTEVIGLPYFYPEREVTPVIRQIDFRMRNGNSRVVSQIFRADFIRRFFMTQMFYFCGEKSNAKSSTEK